MDKYWWRVRLDLSSNGRADAVRHQQDTLEAIAARTRALLEAWETSAKMAVTALDSLEATTRGSI
jgi:hypothetical protein